MHVAKAKVMQYKSEVKRLHGRIAQLLDARATARQKADDAQRARSKAQQGMKEQERRRDSATQRLVSARAAGIQAGNRKAKLLMESDAAHGTRQTRLADKAVQNEAAAVSARETVSDLKATLQD